MPLVWALQAMGVRRASRVYGPDLMLALCRTASQQSIPVGLYGGTVTVRKTVEAGLLERHPALNIVYSHSPSFGPTLSDASELQRMNAAGVGILFVALGCPKQERWMAAHRETLPAVMIGVGAAFDFISGGKRQAPPLLQRMGLEWLFRLASEPRRLWRRYAIHNPRFVVLLAMQLVGRRSHPGNGLARPR
jgi:N-acetylglucosaminyldiphosphoundecaprenol N-acetyl-beta-D-mannosaminyltransferase